jgi:hypothetical protein
VQSCAFHGSSQAGLHDMKIGSFIKSSVDNIRFEVDYSEWLETPEVLFDFQFSSDPTGLTVSNAAINNSTSLIFYVAGGVDTEVYNLLVTAITNQGQVRQDYIVTTVSNPP